MSISTNMERVGFDAHKSHLDLLENLKKNCVTLEIDNERLELELLQAESRGRLAEAAFRAQKLVLEKILQGDKS